MKKFNITVNSQIFEVEVEEVGGATTAATSISESAPVAAPPPKAAPIPAAPKTAAIPVATGATTINAPMPGKILSTAVKPGDAVKRGQVLLILEAMKMQNEIMAPSDGKVADVRVAAGQSVNTGDVMVILG